jgi:hypothetical protein
MVCANALPAKADIKAKSMPATISFFSSLP